MKDIIIHRREISERLSSHQIKAILAEYLANKADINLDSETDIDVYLSAEGCNISIAKKLAGYPND